jgi:hypothetical protein
MKCPECHAKISTKDYDPDYSWYECPKCEGCFTADEIEESVSGTSPGKRAKGNGKVADDIRAGLNRARSVPVAKGKKRQTELLEDEEATAKHEAEMLKPVVTDAPEVHKHRDEVRTKEVVNIMADEIQAVFEIMGGRIDDVNAQDKALVLWRQARIDTGISAREVEVPHVLCKEHA